MKKTLLVGLALAGLLISSASEAKSLGDRLGTLPAAEYGFVAARTADCAETQYILSSHRGYEEDFIYGKHPSPLKLWGICAATVMTHVAAVSIIQDHDEHAAKVVATVSVVVATGIAVANLRIVF